MKGIPTAHPLFSTYWRKKAAPPVEMDPDRDGCGLLWCAPVAPSDGENARELCDLANSVILGHGFEPAISITMITERALTCVISIAYDRCTPGEDERAMRCYRELIGELKQAGYHSYRLGIHVQGENEQPDYSALLSTLRNALDPRGILAPGRYQGTTGTSVLRPRTE
jgi:4-cresol dehydrogenase (hydroxylating)